ncbi:hypothetical protein ElyMa_005541700 [Elysia marginata]|uniref:Secreted protein n=1 Tax=Elysia marginata TaxID=1093978 RepID=A0AAV4EYQ2_9GAST|nr:hypothetical protein ElyMa_005541700 [Elysia marginata]
MASWASVWMLSGFAGSRLKSLSWTGVFVVNRIDQIGTDDDVQAEIHQNALWFPETLHFPTLYTCRPQHSEHIMQDPELFVNQCHHEASDAHSTIYFIRLTSSSVFTITFAFHQSSWPKVKAGVKSCQNASLVTKHHVEHRQVIYLGLI